MTDRDHFPPAATHLIRQGTGPVQAVIQREERARQRDMQIARIVRTSDAQAPTTATTSRATLPGDTRRLRGIPAIGYGVSGAIPGTNPGTVTR